MTAAGVRDVLLRLFGEHGEPAFVRSDNGPARDELGRVEFIAKALTRALAGRGVACRHIEPGSPWQNGLCERFNGSLRDECLNLETFSGVEQAAAVCRLYLGHYNQERPRSSLGYLTPPRSSRRGTSE